MCLSVGRFAGFDSVTHPSVRHPTFLLQLAEKQATVLFFGTHHLGVSVDAIALPCSFIIIVQPPHSIVVQFVSIL